LLISSQALENTARLTTFDVLFFLPLQTRRVILGGLTPYPKEAWIKQVARNLTAADAPMAKALFLLHDRDPKFSEACAAIPTDIPCPTADSLRLSILTSHDSAG
jgi:hypothetical protein